MTQVIAGNVRRLRDGARLSGAALAALMQQHGIPWNRTTVAKLETGRRESISVQELLGLAVALDVPPIWLLADATAGAQTAITAEVSRDPWATLLWMAGRSPIHEEPGIWWDRVAPNLALVYALHSAIEQLRRNHAVQTFFSTSSPEMAEYMDTDEEIAAKDRKALLAIASNMTSLGRTGLAPVVLPDDVRTRAEELGIKLSGAEG